MAKQKTRVTLDLTLTRVDDEECVVNLLDEYFGGMTVYMDGSAGEELKWDVEDVVVVRVFDAE